MKTKLFFITIFLFSLPLTGFSKDYNKGKLPNIASPAWVYPSNRKNYPGYDKKKNKIQNSRDWKYSTNRPTGKNRGGGTLEYYDYRSIRQRTSEK